MSPPWTAFVKIAEGCDQACGFCAIPTFRGKQRSRAIEDVCAELRQLARDGVVEANLISQDSTGFGRDHGAKDGLADLVRAIDALDEGPAWVRLHYLYPGRITDGLLEALAASRRFVEYVDLPLQHAHPAVLKRMRRPGSAESYLAHLAELRRALPDAGVRSGFIVGFPGETEDEFQTLVDFVQQAGCDAAGIFTYSHEADTPAFALDDDVPAEVKEERRQILDDVVENVALERALQRVGSRLAVLIEGPSEDDPEVAFARWRGQAAEVDGRVIVEGAAHLAAGTLATVEITGAAPYELTGRLVDGAAA
jgi:ribosomal protein S12 methylthiotransferase